MAEHEHPSAEKPTLRSRHWILWRLLIGVITLFVVSLLVFAATQALPSDPARRILGQNASEEQVEAVRDQLGLDRPLSSQYWSWLSGASTGDFGTSLTAQRPVGELLGPRLQNSAVLVILAALISVPLSILLGAVAALKRDSWFDHGFVYGSLIFVALPVFVTGMLLLMLFSTSVWTLLPAIALFPAGETALRHPEQLVLPVATLVLAVIPYLGRLARASMIDVLDSEYIQMARLKGMPDRIVIWRHALPNALVPFVQGTALVLAWLVGGIVVVEYLFGYPGLGGAFVDAVANRDIPVVQGIVLIFAALYVLFNLAADILTVYLTPRLRTAR